MKYDQHKYGVIEAVAWRTVIARHLSIKGYQIRICCKEIETAKSINNDHVNSSFLPDILIPETLDNTTNLLDITLNVSILVVVIPSHFTREIARFIKPEKHLSIS